jgi:hypothetical protein
MPSIEQQPQAKLPAAERAGGVAEAGAGMVIDVRLDTPAQASTSSRIEELATLFDAAYLDKDTFQRKDRIIVRWPEHFSLRRDIVLRIQTPSGRIFLEKQFVAQAGTVADLGRAYLLPAGDYDVVLMPSLGEYYLGNVRVQRKVAISLFP